MPWWKELDSSLFNCCCFHPTHIIDDVRFLQNPKRAHIGPLASLPQVSSPIAALHSRSKHLEELHLPATQRSQLQPATAIDCPRRFSPRPLCRPRRSLFQLKRCCGDRKGFHWAPPSNLTDGSLQLSSQLLDRAIRLLDFVRPSSILSI